MTILLNGQMTTINADSTVYDIVCQLSESPPPPGIAVALNLDVIPRAQWKEQTLNEQDELEILWASSGG